MHATLPQVRTVDAVDRRDIGRGPGILLAMLAALPIAGTLLVAQILPQMEAAFADTPDVRLRVSIALTVPALVIALCSAGVGWLADRVGKRRLLTLALILYAALGLAPMILRSLDGIIAARAGMGIAEGIIMTCSTALIGDLYSAAQRERLLSLQTACASIAAVLFAIIGGVLGDLGWRTPFAVYAIALLLLPVLLFVVPTDRTSDRTSDRAGDRAPDRATRYPAEAALGRLPWQPLIIICAATVILSLSFYAAQIQLPYLLNGLGPVAPSTVGLVSALTNSAVVCGSICFVLFRTVSLRTVGLLCFVLIAAGLGLTGAARGYTALCAGLVIVSFAGGIALPTFLNGAMALLNPLQRGTGAGVWQSSFWAGQFFSPILVIMLTQGAGGLSAAITVCAIGTLFAGGLVSVLLAGRTASGAPGR